MNDRVNIINSSLQTGTFPASLKHAVISPLLMKNNLDPSVTNKYRPISNLPFLSKIPEKVVYRQLDTYLSTHNIYDTYQSGFRAKHSTETALVRVINDLEINSDSKKSSVLVLLDLTAAFYTVDHDILIHRLHDSVSLRGSVLNWFSSYLKDRTFHVAIGNFKSAEMKKIPLGFHKGQS